MGLGKIVLFLSIRHRKRVGCSYGDEKLEPQGTQREHRGDAASLHHFTGSVWLGPARRNR